ncbi:hypothetical protein Tco_1277117 [Tanacetum coccineum]
MSDAAAAPSGGASRSQAFNAPIHSFRYLTGDAIHMDFFPFTPSPYYATYSEDGVVHGSYEVTDLNDKVSSSDAAFVKDKAKGKDRKKKIKSLSKSLDQLTAEVSHLSFDLNQSRNVVAQKDAEVLRLRAFPPEFASFFQGDFQSLVQKFLAIDEFSRVQGELLYLTANASFERGLCMDQTQEQFDAALKNISRFMPEAQSRLIKATLLVATTNYPFQNKVVAHSAQPLSDIVDLKPDRLACPVVVPTTRAKSSLIRGSKSASFSSSDVVVALSFRGK